MRHGRRSWRVLFAAVLAVAAAVALRMELSRRRRSAVAARTRCFEVTKEQDVRPAEVTLEASGITEAGHTGAQPPVSEAGEPAVAAMDRRRSQSHAARHARWSTRRLPGIAIAATAVAFILPVVAGVAGLGGARGVPGATLAAEPVDTETGVVVMAHGQHFTPNADVELYWQHPGGDAVHATASPTGEVIAAVSLPHRHAGMPDGGGPLVLVASDGTQQAVASFAPGGDRVIAPESSVLGSTSTSRILVNGQPYFLLGADYPWVNYGNDFGSNAWGSYGVHSGGSYASDFADMKSKAVHVARWWVFADGRAGMNFASDGTPLGVQPVVYADLSQALTIAQQNNIYLDLVLFDVSLLAQPTYVGGVQMGGHADLLTNPAKRSALVNNVIAPLAKRFGSNPMVISWELMNEPEWAISDLPRPAFNQNYTPVTMSQFWAFGSAASQIIHLSTTQDVTVGSAALKWNQVWTDAFAIEKGLPTLGLDFYQTHYYQWMDCCSTIDDPDLGTTTWSPLTQPVSALGLDKPIVVGEIHTPTGSAGPQLDAILANGYAGAWAWSYKYTNTGDQLQIDWSTYTLWEAAHASIVRIPAPSPSATPTATAQAATPTQTATVTGALPTATPKSASPTATSTSPATATNTPPPATPPSTSTPPPAAPTATSTPNPPTPTATSTPNPPTPTATSTPNPPTPTATSTPAAGSTGIVQFGRMSSVGFNDSSDVGYLNGSPYALTASGTLTSLSIYVGSTPAGAHVRLGLYSTTPSGMPGTLLAQTGEAVAVAGWNTQPVASGPNLTPGMYWLLALTDNPGTVYRMAAGLPPTNAVGWAVQAYGPFPVAAGSGWTMFTNQAFSMYGTVATSDPPASGAATPQPTVSVPLNETLTPINTPTPTSTPVTVPTPTPSSGLTAFELTVCPTKLDPSGQSQCGSSVGNLFDYHFCDRWSGGFCDDFRTAQYATHTMFPMPGDPYSLDMVSTTGPYYFPWQGDCCTDGPPPTPMGFTAYEHMMMIMADGLFGNAILRLHQPFDFANRAGHIHFDVDTKTGARRYLRFMLSPDLTKRGTDDRDSHVYPINALEVFIIDGNISGTLIKNNSCGSGYCLGNAFSVNSVMPLGHDNVRDHIDLSVSRTHIKLVMNGVTYLDTNMPDIGFDRSYVYLEQASYNPCKDGPKPGEIWPNLTLDQCSVAAQEFHWDNIAFDGPVLPTNSLTPQGFEDVVFNAYSVGQPGTFNPGQPGNCTVKGVPASPLGAALWGNWVTWMARLPVGTPVSRADIACISSWSPASGVDQVQGLEVVQPGR